MIKRPSRSRLATTLAALAAMSATSIGQVASPQATRADDLDGLLDNGGFEAPFSSLVAQSSCPGISGSLSNAWEDNSCWQGTAVQLSYADDATQPHSGQHALRLELETGLAQVVQPLELETDTLYRGSIWMRASTPMTVSVALRKADIPYTNYVVTTAELTPQWKRYRFSGFCEATAGLFIVRAEADGLPGAQSVWIDGAALHAKPRELPLGPGLNGPIPHTLFGMHIHDSDLVWPSPGNAIGAVRIWDADGPDGPATCAQWSCTHLGPDTFDWSALDEHVARATANNAEVVYNLGRTPVWASARPSEPSSYGPGQAAEPADDAVWRAWVTAVATRYQGLITNWEIWNEPNDLGFFTGTPEKLVSLASQAHSILKSIDPGNRVLTPSPYDLEYLDRYLALGGGQFADVVGYHFYLVEDETPEYMYASYLPNALHVLERQGLSHLPLWNTEAGWFAPPPLPEEQGVGYLARTYLLNWAAGSPRFYFYSWDGYPDAGVAPSFGPQYTTPTAAGVAYAEVAEWIVGARMLAPQRNGDVWTIELERPGQVRTHVVWNASHTSSFDVPSAWGASTVRDLAGSVAPLPISGVMTIDGRPLLIE